MPVISCTKFGINQTILTVFSGVRAKKPPPPPQLKKAENAVGNRVKVGGMARFWEGQIENRAKFGKIVIFPELKLKIYPVFP